MNLYGKNKKERGAQRTLLCFSGVQKAQAMDISKRGVFSAGMKPFEDHKKARNRIHNLIVQTER
jgi:hypothetical protein